jgi:hypothetical protein
MRRTLVRFVGIGILVVGCKTTSDDSGVKHHEEVTQDEHLTKFLDLLEDPECDQTVTLTSDKKIIQKFNGEPNKKCMHSYLYFYFVEKMDMENKTIIYDPYRTPREARKIGMESQPCVESVTIKDDGFVVVAKKKFVDNCVKLFKPTKVNGVEMQVPFKSEQICNIQQGVEGPGRQAIIFTQDMSTERGNSPAAGLWGYSYARANVDGKEYNFDHCDIMDANAPMGFDFRCYDTKQGDSADKPQVRLGLGGWGSLVSQFSTGKKKVDLICQQ